LADDLTALAGMMLGVRKSRAAHVPADLLRGEQVWDMLLILFIADGRGERLTGRSVLGEDGGSTETGRRWIQYLTRIGYVVGDGQGDIEDVLTMTPEGVHVLETWLREAFDRYRDFSVERV
jgi:hypothetical protein